MKNRPFTLLGIVFFLLPIFASAASCPNLTRSLSFGSRGNDVVQLQQFLISQNLLAAGNDTGYFGRLTEVAVKKFQCREMQICSGSAASNGYGVVGPRTRTMIARMCSQSSQSSQSSSSSASSAGAAQTGGQTFGMGTGQTSTINFSASPMFGTAPLRVVFRVAAEWTSMFSIEFGDGQSSALQNNCPGGGIGACGQPTAEHIYSNSGTFIAQFIKSDLGGCGTNADPRCLGAPASRQVLGTITITVSSSAPVCEHAAPPEGCSWQSGATCTEDRLVCDTTNASCTFNNQSIPHGNSVTAYQAPSVPNGSQCVSQVRSCNNGTLSGSYQYLSCAVDSPSLTPPSGLTASCAPNGKSVTLSWNPVSGAANYGIRVTQEGSGIFNEIKDWYAQTTYTSFAIAPGLSFGWWVHANPATGMLGPNSNPPSLFTCNPPNPPQTLLVDSFDAYSAEPVYINGALKIYFGGWMTQADLPHDSIFVADCNSTGISCSNIRKVLDPVPSGFYQVNDPSIILHPAIAPNPAYYIMYMTCNQENTVPAGHDGTCYATSYDGITWSAPSLLMANHWLPSAVWKKDHVELWVNDNSNNQQLQMFNLGYSGIAVGSPTAVVQDNVASNNDMNVNVVWRSTLNMYQILAERAVRGSSSVIDYLDSADGVHWNLRHAAVVQPVAGSRVGTPAQHPDNAFMVFFGKTTDLVNSMAFKIYSAQWSTN